MKLTTRLFMYIVLLLILFSGVFGYQSVRDERAHLIKEAKERSWMLARTLAVTFRYYHQENFTVNLQMMMSSISGSSIENILALNIYDKNGSLAESVCMNCGDVELPHRVVSFDEIMPDGKGEEFTISNRRLFSVVYPIVSGQEVRGAIEVVSSLDYINYILASARLRFILFSLISALLLGLVVYAIVRVSVSIPIRNLKEAAEKLGMGDLSLRIPKSGVRELDDLIEVFNRMAENIERRTKEREEFYEEKLRLERNLRHSEKLASIGQLVSGLAHEIGTPLNIISGRAQFLEKKLPPDVPGKENLRIIVKQIERISDLISRLLTFSRKATGEFSYVDLQEIVEEAYSLCRIKYGSKEKDVKLELKVDAKKIYGDANGLRQMFFNLMLNSFQAIDGEGTVRVSSRLLDLDGSPKILIEFMDSGSGIPPENRDRIFDPFFTTKDVGEGTGLGLYIVSSIVNEHGGQIYVEESDSGGAKFVIQLPFEENTGHGNDNSEK